MPRLIDYEQTTAALRADGLECLYYNSGAFGFPRDAATHTVGWIGPADGTIRPAARPLVRTVKPPHETRLAALTRLACDLIAVGPVWVLPKSHWHYEMNFGNAEWLPHQLEAIGIPPDDLRERNNGSAIEFTADERDALHTFLKTVLTHLANSDFALAFPGRPLICTVHHHKQLWWTTTDDEIHRTLQAVVAEDAG